MKHTKTNLIKGVWDEFNTVTAKKSGALDSTFLNRMMADIFCPGPHINYVIDFASQEFSYLGENMGKHLGLNISDHRLNDFLKLIHPDDLPHVVKCEEKVLDFIANKIPPQKITKYKFVYSHRYKHLDGQYHLYLHQAIALSLDEFERMSQVLSVDVQIGHITNKNNMLLSIIGLDGEPSYLGINPYADIESYLTPISNDFSSRELEVIRLFSEGYTAKEIAGLLHVSEGTVRTHRQNVLAKSDCRNMTSLVAWCIRQGWV